MYEPQRFAPKDLLTLLRKIETEAAACESGIREEKEKRRKHRVDDCRRVHNYDEFVTTFISMLAEQGRRRRYDVVVGIEFKFNREILSFVQWSNHIFFWHNSKGSAVQTLSPISLT